MEMYLSLVDRRVRMALRSLAGELGLAVSVFVGLVGFFAVLLVLNVVLSPFGIEDQTIGIVAAVVFFASFWAMGLRYVLGSS